MIKLLNHLKTWFELRRLSMSKKTQGEPLSVLDDIVFKQMLTSGSEDSKEALRHLLSACTRRQVTKVMVLNNELLPAYLGAKSPRLDVRVTFNDGEVADLEMQKKQTDDDLKNRSTIYSASLIASQAKRGKLYKDIKKAYQIFFLDDILFPNSDKLPRRYGYREETEHDLLTDSSEIIYYELPKLEQRVKDYFSGIIGIEDLSAEEKWCIFLKYRHEKQAETLISEICQKEEGIMRAEKEVVKVSRSYLRHMTVEMDEIKNNIDLMFKLKAAHDKGRDEGLDEGRAEREAEAIAEKMQIAKKLKEIGHSPEQIAEITGLSIEAINDF